MAADEDWRKNKMNSEEVQKAGVEGSKRPPGNNPGRVLHQRRKLHFSTITMAVAGLVIIGTIGYFTLYAQKKPEASSRNVAKVPSIVAIPEDSHPRKQLVCRLGKSCNILALNSMKCSF